MWVLCYLIPSLLEEGLSLCLWWVFFSHPGLRETELNIFLINGYTFAGKRSLFYSCKREIYRCCGCCSSFHKSFLCIYHFGFDCCKQISLSRACYSFEPTREGLLERAVYCCCCNSHWSQTSLSVWFSSLLRHPRLAFLIFLSPRCSIEIFSQITPHPLGWGGLSSPLRCSSLFWGPRLPALGHPYV